MTSAKKSRSTKEQFNKDKNAGEAFENYVKQCFIDAGYVVEDREDEKSLFDFFMTTKGFEKAPNKLRVEVKYDKRSKSSGNYGFEMYYRDNPSGILKNQEHDIWVQGVEEEFHVFMSDSLRETLEEKLHTKECKFYAIFGDGSSGAVIKKENITPHSFMEFRNGKEFRDGKEVKKS